MKILYIAPLPPPITGHSIVSQVLLNSLVSLNEVKLVNLSRNSNHDGSIGIKRIFSVFGLLNKIINNHKKIDVIYLTISESIAGNIKDLIIYLVLFRSIKKIVIHLHGGSFKECVLDKSLMLRLANHFFLSRLNAVIISGSSHAPIFDELLNEERLRIVPNFAQDHLFLDAEAIDKKFSGSEDFRLLYLSGMTKDKGYLRILEAYEMLDSDIKGRIKLDFAGQFSSDLEQNIFENRIKGLLNVTYHGLVSEEKKAKLFAQTHIFCLPTSLMEGQPISILEAYASGCVVLTTLCPGILDIFKDEENGYQIYSDQVRSLSKTLGKLSKSFSELHVIASRNRSIAENSYREKIYCQRVTSVLSSATH